MANVDNRVWLGLNPEAAALPASPFDKPLGNPFKAEAQDQKQLLLGGNPPVPTTPMPVNPAANQRVSLNLSSGPTWAAPPEMASDIEAALGQRKEQFQGLQDMRQQQLAQQQQQLEAMQAKGFQTDYSPIAGLIDQWTGSNLAAQYQRPESPEERAAKEQQMRNAMMQGQIGMSQADLDFSQAELESALGKEDRAMKSAEAKFNRMIEGDKLKLDKIRTMAAAANSGKGLDQKAIYDIRKGVSETGGAKMVSGINMLGALDEYEKVVRENGGINATGPAAAKIESAYNNLALKYKNAAELGALAGPDLALIESNIQRAGGLSSWLKSSSIGGSEGVYATIAQAREGAHRDYALSMEQLRNNFAGIDAATPVLDGYDKQFNRLTKKSVSSSRAAKIAQLRKLRGE